jgi:hypothetical protein
MPRDGCRECLYRRIRCDKTNPSCQKCIKKGIECSGVGKFCFVEGVTRRRRKIPAPSSSTSSKVNSNTILENVAPEAQEMHASNSFNNARSPSRLAIEHEPSNSNPQHVEQQLSLPAVKSSAPPGLLSHQTYQQCNVRTDLALEGLKPGISELLMNCKLWSSLLLVHRPAF